MYVREYDGFVIATSINKPIDMAEWIEVDGVIPPRPEAKDDTEPRLMLVDGALVYQSAPTHAEVKAQRAAAYRERVDPITSEIERLKDELEFELDQEMRERLYQAIAEARERRTEAVKRLKEEFPYPEEGE